MSYLNKTFWNTNKNVCLEMLGKLSDSVEKIKKYGSKSVTSLKL